jgi:serine protease
LNFLNRIIMKKTIIFIPLVCFTIIAYSQSSNNYFWSDKRKISLVSDSTNWTLIPVRGYSKQSVSSQMKTESTVTDLRSSIGSDLIDFTLKSHSKQNVIRLKQKFSSHGEITCWHLVNGKTPIILTGEILLQPKKAIALEKIIDLVRTKAKLTNSTEYNTFVLKANKIEDVMNIANQIYESGLVNWCHPDFWAEIVKTTADPLYNQQYYLNQANNIDINAPEAFAITQGCNNIRVAVIDDGVENHEDINGRVLQGFTARNVNGFGAPVANLPPVNLSIVGHGQACAGIIGATQDNNLGIGGIAPNSRIIPVNIFSDWFIDTDINSNQFIRFRETPQDLAASINWSWNPVQGNAQVVSNSWGFNNTAGPGGIDSDAIRQAITNARTQGRGGLGSIVVFASGNSNIRSGCSTAQGCFNGVSFPANVDGVITVGAIDRNGNIWDYSSRGTEMDLVAPSGGPQGDVATTDRMGANGYNAGNYTATFNGTSAACPQVSGVAALMISANPNLTEAQITTILQQTATDMGATGFDNTFGFGRLNAEAALRRIITDLGISLNGPNLVCTTGQFTLANQPAGTTLTWSSSNSLILSINATTGLATSTGDFNGNVNVIATLTNANACSAPLNVIRTILSGAPTRPTSLIGPTTVSAACTYSYSALGTVGADSYSWTLPNTCASGCWKILTSPPNLSTLLIEAGSLSGTMSVRGVNGCGLGLSRSINIIAGAPSPGCKTGTANFLIFPNPATNQLSIDIGPSSSIADDLNTANESEIKVDQSTDFEAKLFSPLSQLVKSGSSQNGTIVFNVADLQNGIYYLHIVAGSQIFRKQVMISK